MGKGFILWRGFAEGENRAAGEARAGGSAPRLRRVPVPFAHGGGEER